MKGAPAPRMSVAEAIEHLRADPRHAELIHDSYLDADTRQAAERFERSGEFAEVTRLIGDRVAGGTVLDLGAGSGIASFALARAGADRVYAVEPDPSPVVGRGAIRRIALERIEVLAGSGEEIPLPDEAVDIVFSRQVLHHVEDLPALALEVRRVLRAGGIYLACREPVIKREQDLDEFLAHHEVHQLAGGENAELAETYLEALRGAGLRISRAWRPMDSVINAFPLVRSEEELQDLRRRLLGPRMGRINPRLAERIPLAGRRVRAMLAPYEPPGAMWSFEARKHG